MSLDRRVVALERLTVRLGFARAGIPGTVFQRIERSVGFLKTQGVIPDNGPTANDRTRYQFIWCLGIGSQGCPKQFYYGLTMKQCIESAEEGLTQIEKQLRRKK